MKEITTILILLVAGFSNSVKAQVTAVMQAKVQIVSGSSISEVQESRIDLNQIDIAEKIEAGHFTLQTSPDAEVNVSVYNESGIVNLSGESLEFASLFIDHTTSANGEHDIKVNGFLKNIPESKSSYSGKLVTVIEYL